MKTLAKYTPIVYFDIWAPKYSTMHTGGSEEVWLLKDRVDHARVPDIKIKFTRTKALKYEGLWYITQKQAKKCKVGWNGKAFCYRIPFTELEPLTIDERDWRSLV